MFTLISDPWAWHALIATIFVSTLCSLLGVAVVLKRMAFIGQGVSHAAFGGVGTASLLAFGGLARDGVVLVFCVAAALLIGLLSRRRIERDTAIGILLVAAMAWGVTAEKLAFYLRDHWPAYQSWTGGWTPRLGFEDILFGSVFTVSTGWLWTAGVVTVLLVALLAVTVRPMLFFLFDEKTSVVFGVRAGLMQYLLLAALGVSVVITMRVAGVILTTALLVLPAATALLVSQRWPWVVLWSWLVGVVTAVVGLWLSLVFGELLPGPTMVLVMTAVFGVVWLWRGGYRTWA